MANHKRKRPKAARAGCLHCKPWKANGQKGRRSQQTMQERIAQESDKYFAEQETHAGDVPD